MGRGGTRDWARPALLGERMPEDWALGFYFWPEDIIFGVLRIASLLSIDGLWLWWVVYWSDGKSAREERLEASSEVMGRFEADGWDRWLLSGWP